MKDNLRGPNYIFAAMINLNKIFILINTVKLVGLLNILPNKE